jgi:hypothetical protein
MGDQILAGSGRFWTIRFRAAFDHAPVYHGNGMAGAPDWAQGDLEKIEVPSETRYNEWKQIASFQASPDRPTLPLTTMFQTNRSEMYMLTKLRCAFDVQVHMGECEDPRDFDAGWQKILVFEDSRVTNYAPTELGAMEGGDQGAIKEEVEISARDIYDILRMDFREVAQAYVSEEIVAISICDNVNCGTCGGDPSDGCSRVIAVSSPEGSSPGILPQVIVTKNAFSTAFERTITSIALGANISDGTCAGSNYVALSSTENAIHYAITADIFDQIETWTKVVTGFVATKTPNAIWSNSALDTFIVANGGYIYKLATAPGSGVTVLDAGSTTSQNLLDVDGYDATHVVAVGANNTVLYTTDGETWASVTGPLPAATLEAVAMRTEDEWWVGTSAGAVYATRNRGTNWTLISLPLAITAVDKIVWATDTVGFIAGEIVGPLGRVFRTVNSGNSWYVMPETPGGTTPANDKINDMAVCEKEANMLYMGGLADNAGDGIIIKGFYESQ